MSKKYIELLFFTCFIVVAALLLWLNEDVLYMAQQHSLFLRSTHFFADKMREVGGLLIWLGLTGTQCFHYPALGIALLLTLWALIYQLLHRTFPLPHSWRWLHLLPLSALVASIIGVGYWLYYLKMPGYWVRESIGLLLALFLQQVFIGFGKGDSVKPRKGWQIAGILLAAASYPLLGWYSTLALLLMAVRSALQHCWQSLCLALIAATMLPPVIARQYTTLRWQEAWTAHFPHAEFTGAESSLITGAFVALTLILIVIVVVSHLQPKRGGWKVATTGALAAVCGMLCTHITDYNFHAELRMYRALEECRWDDVLQDMKEAPSGPTRQMVSCKNVALLHKGSLAQDMFRYDNIGPEPIVPDSLPLHMAHTCAPLLYLYHGMANDATHWAIENSVEFGFTNDNLKILALAALVSNETDLARKYFDLLRIAPFNEAFVHRYYPLLFKRELMSQQPEMLLMCELNRDLDTRVRKDDGSPEFRIYRTFAEVTGYQSVRTEELALIYSMMLKSYECFWPHLYAFSRLTRSGKMPVAVQEAAYLGCQHDAEHYPASNFRFDANIPARYEVFHSVAKPINDHSYWYFYYFCNDAKTY
ncbi:MAG: DUF6057 family protein [Bacteroidales bacterium]|nr:DUF6057 family protein [Bacteroidales bacterium]